MTRLLVDAAICPLSEFWREAVRHAEEVVAADGNFAESYAPKCFIRNGAGAEVQLDHDGQVIGHVTTVVGSRYQHMHIAEMLIEGDEKLLERVRVGQAVSLDAYSHASDTDHLARTRRHELVELRHVAVLRDRDIPGYRHARIVKVQRLKDEKAVTASGIDWRSELPHDWEWARDAKWELEPGTTLLDGRDNRTSGWLWTGEKFVRSAAARLAA